MSTYNPYETSHKSTTIDEKSFTPLTSQYETITETITETTTINLSNTDVLTTSNDIESQ